MKNILLFLLLWTSTCRGQNSHIQVLYSGDTYLVNSSREVVMDDHTFGMYHYYKERFDSLKSSVLKYNIQLSLTDSLNEAVLRNLKDQIIAKDVQIRVADQSFFRLKRNLQQSISETEKCKRKFKDLHTKYGQKKVQLKIFRSITLGFTVLTIVILVL